MAVLCRNGIVGPALRFALAALVLGATAGLGRAGDPHLLSYTDIQVTVRAREALRGDKPLDAVNLSVRVEKGVAVVRGAVPSEELKTRAVDVLKKVKDVKDVNAEGVFVAVPPPEPPPAPKPEPAPTRTEAALPTRDPDALASLTNRPAGAPPPGDSGVRLMQPVTAESLAATTSSAAPPADDLSAALDRVRQSSPRYRSIAVRVEGATATVRGGGRAEDAMAFVKEISHLPGLNRVVLEP
jgi:hypothetical protein